MKVGEIWLYKKELVDGGWRKYFVVGDKVKIIKLQNDNVGVEFLKNNNFISCPRELFLNHFEKCYGE